MVDGGWLMDEREWVGWIISLPASIIPASAYS
jgi:hypothetical protein